MWICTSCSITHVVCWHVVLATVLAQDESHKAKHFVPGKESQSTRVATCVLDLQARLPNARVVYCSATGVSEVANMAV